MRNFSEDSKDGYRMSVDMGIEAANGIGRDLILQETDIEVAKDIIKDKIKNSEATIIGAGAGLSTSAGFTYSGERFLKYFGDFARTYGIRDMYSGGFYPFPDSETFWAWWSRHIYFNRYIDAPKPVYENLFELFKNENYFVITTNVDHRFRVAGFEKERIFYTQGDYGLFQSENPENKKTYDNKEIIEEMIQSQGFVRNARGEFDLPSGDVSVVSGSGGQIKMRVPKELIPICPDDGSFFAMNLRSDDTFVEDDGWHAASGRYADFLKKHASGDILFIELGIGGNTPVIIKYPFWQMTYENPKSFYACINYEEAPFPEVIKDRTVCVKGDIAEILLTR